MEKIFDSHAHLDSNSFKVDRHKIIEETLKETAGFINPGCELESSNFAVELSKQYKNVYAAVGFHPHDAKLMQENDEEKLTTLAQKAKTVAIGEIGLDYYYNHSPKDVQKKIFIRQLDLARNLNLPVIIHNRDAHADVLEIIKNEGKGIRGVFHCYSGSWEMAKILLKMNWFISFGGSLTFKNAVKTVEVARNIPLESVLLETDSPYLTPVPFRGKRNNPTMTKYVCERLAEIKNTDYDIVARTTRENTYNLFDKIVKIN